MASGKTRAYQTIDRSSKWYTEMLSLLLSNTTHWRNKVCRIPYVQVHNGQMMRQCWLFPHVHILDSWSCYTSTPYMIICNMHHTAKYVILQCGGTSAHLSRSSAQVKAHLASGILHLCYDFNHLATKNEFITILSLLFSCPLLNCCFQQYQTLTRRTSKHDRQKWIHNIIYVPRIL